MGCQQHQTGVKAEAEKGKPTIKAMNNRTVMEKGGRRLKTRIKEVRNGASSRVHSGKIMRPPREKQKKKNGEGNEEISDEFLARGGTKMQNQRMER